MNNEEILTNYLSIIKSNVEVYVHGTLEASTPEVRKVLKYCLDYTMSMQEDVYNEMTSRGYYNVENVSSSEIQKVIDKLNNSCS